MMMMILHLTSWFNQASRFCPPRDCRTCLNPVCQMNCEGEPDRSKAEGLWSRRPQPRDQTGFRQVWRRSRRSKWWFGFIMHSLSFPLHTLIPSVGYWDSVPLADLWCCIWFVSMVFMEFSFVVWDPVFVRQKTGTGSSVWCDGGRRRLW